MNGNYRRTSMARTALGPWKFVRDMGCSSHWGLIRAQDQKAIISVRKHTVTTVISLENRLINDRNTVIRLENRLINDRNTFNSWFEIHSLKIHPLILTLAYPCSVIAYAGTQNIDFLTCRRNNTHPASILRKSTSGRHRPVSYPDGPMTARYRFT